MIFDRQAVRQALAKTIAFFQTNNIDYPELSPSLTTSPSFRYVNEVSGLLTIENIDQSKKNFSVYPYPTWLIGTEYTKGDLITDTTPFEYINDTPSSGNLTSDTNYWFPIDDLNDYLHQKRFASADKVIDYVFNEKKIATKVKSIFENIPLFDGVANYRDFETNADKFVGLRFRMKKDRSILTVINYIGHQFTGTIMGLELYLYHSSQQEPLTTFTIDHTKANSSEWAKITSGNELRYLDDAYDAGGEFYLGYKQSDLEAVGISALNMSNLSWRGEGCTSCNNSRSLWRTWTPWVDITSFSIAESAFNPGVDMFDPQDVSFSPSLNYGLNLRITNECDIGNLVIEQAGLFAESMQHSAGLDLVRDMAVSTRGTNNDANQLKILAEREIYNFPDAWGTLYDRTMKSYGGIRFDLSGLRSECLACDDEKADIIQPTVTFR